MLIDEGDDSLAGERRVGGELSEKRVGCCERCFEFLVVAEVGNIRR